MRNRGCGCFYEKDRMILGFAVVDLIGKKVWALFPDPAATNYGIGKQLKHMMLNWYFTKTNETHWLSI
jgi:hypothetical protein